jgi:hypothetical protein
MIEIFPPLKNYKYDTWRIVLVKCYVDNFVRLWSCIRNVNICFAELSPFLDVLYHCSLFNLHFCYFCQNKYCEEMMRLHGEGVNWR